MAKGSLKQPSTMWHPWVKKSRSLEVWQWLSLISKD